MERSGNGVIAAAAAAAAASPSGRWHTLETVKVFYGPDDCVNGIAEIRFDRPVPIKVCSTARTYTDTACK